MFHRNHFRLGYVESRCTNTPVKSFPSQGHWLDTDSRSVDHYREHAENFNRWGELCNGAGIQVAYHNHQFEFEETEGVKHGFIERDNSKDISYSLQHNSDAIEPLWTSHMGSKT